MTLKEVLDMHIRTEQGLRFDVEYSCVSHDVETDELIGFTLIKTAEEAYQEWLADKDKTVEPNEMEVLKEEVIALEKENKLLKAQVEALSQTSDFHEELIVEMANKVYA